MRQVETHGLASLSGLLWSGQASLVPGRLTTTADRTFMAQDLGVAGVPAELDTIPGWFYLSDRACFVWALDYQRRHGVTGDLLELGCYLGKSAVLLGKHVGPGENLVVLDLFERAADDSANDHEQKVSYAALSRRAFEANYLRFHAELPVVIQGFSSVITDHLEAGSCRLVHVDASHMYEHVRGDAAAVRLLLKPGGIVVFDDYRSEHTPGVAAAVWEAVLNDGLVPLWVTPGKLYGTWSDPGPILSEFWSWIGEHDQAWGEWQDVAGHALVRMHVRPVPAPVSTSPEPVRQSATGEALQRDREPGVDRRHRLLAQGLRMVGKGVTPPFLSSVARRLSVRSLAARGRPERPAGNRRG